MSTLRRDLVAGLTVAIVAFPLAMALAIASGASPEKGLITAIIGGFLISLLGGSRVQIGGPTGAFVVVIFNVIANHGYEGLILATLMAGIILVIAGYLKLGQVIKFIPYPVITGFTAGIAIIIVSSQVKDFFGLEINNIPADFIPKWSSYFKHFDQINMDSLYIGSLSFFTIVTLHKYAPKLPAYLLAIIGSSLLVFAFHFPVETIGSRFPNISTTFPHPALPEFSFLTLKAVLPSALIIAFLGGIEALLSAVVADGMTGYKHRSNQELVGQGFANIATALFAGLPATGAIARTAANIKAGGTTPFSGIFHALFLLIFMMLTMSFINYVPMASLAAVLFVVAWGMSEAHHFITLSQTPGTDRVILLLTFCLTVLVDLTVAIGVGVTLASLLFIQQMRNSVAITTSARCKTDTFDAENQDDEDPAQREDLPSGVEVFRITGPLFFGVASEIMDTFLNIGQAPKVLIIRMKHVPFLDTTGASAIKNLIAVCAKNDTHVILSHIQKQPHDLLEQNGITKSLGNVSFKADYVSAIHLAKQLLKKS